MTIQTVYWRRRHGFPADGIGEVAVVRSEVWQDDINGGWFAPPVGVSHDGWQRLDVDLDGGDEYAASDIWGSLGLCGDTTCPAAIEDGVAVSAAIMAHLGLRRPIPEDMVYDCPWAPSTIDDGGTDEEPSARYVELQAHCALVYGQLRDALAEKHGIDISPLAES